MTSTHTTQPTGRKASAFWKWSLLFHISLFAVLAILPARKVFLPEEEEPKAPEVTIQGDQLEEVVDTIRESEAEALAMRVALLRGASDRMSQNKETFRTRFSEFETDQVKTARQERERAANALQKRSQRLITMMEGPEVTPKSIVAAWEAPIRETEKMINEVLNLQEEVLRASILLEEPANVQERLQKLINLTLESEQHFGWALGAIRGYHSQIERIQEAEIQRTQEQEKFYAASSENAKKRHQRLMHRLDDNLKKSKASAIKHQENAQRLFTQGRTFLLRALQQQAQLLSQPEPS